MTSLSSKVRIYNSPKAINHACTITPRFVFYTIRAFRALVERHAALSERHGGGILRFQNLGCLPRRDPRDMDSVADHVGGALLAFGSNTPLKFNIDKSGLRVFLAEG